MQNDFRADGDGLTERPGNRPAESQPLTDREVPLGQLRTSPAIHAWLDGELPESEVQGAEYARERALWARVNAETAARRETRAPARLRANVMAAIRAADAAPGAPEC